jgi:hypothetical protein
LSKNGNCVPYCDSECVVQELADETATDGSADSQRACHDCPNVDRATRQSGCRDAWLLWVFKLDLLHSRKSGEMLNVFANVRNATDILTLNPSIPSDAQYKKLLSEVNDLLRKSGCV